MKKTLVVLGAIVGLLVLTVFVVGSLMPRAHVASSTIVLPLPPDSVWPTVRDFEGMPAWWSDLDRVERLEDADGREAWRHHMSSGALAIAVERSEAPRILVTRILADPQAPFGGIWTYQLDPVDAGTRLTIIEAGYINSRVYRFVAGTFMGFYGTMDSYLTDLARHLGSEADPVHLD